MSQNFELLQQLETEFQFEEIAKRVPCVAKRAKREDEGSSQELLALAQTLFLSGDAHASKAVAFCGIDSENASSQICIELGRILAAYSTRPVCLVDAHLRSPRLEKMLRPNEPTSFMDHQDGCQEISPNVWLGHLESSKGGIKQTGLGLETDLKQQLAKLQHKFGFVLIDSPGVNTGAEAAVLGQCVDGVILIIEANVTRKAAALRARQSLEAVNVRILGSLLNNRTFPIPESLYRKL